MAEQAIMEFAVESPRGTRVRVKNGTYTIVSDATGDHRTLRVRTVQSGSLAGRRILALLVGPQNTSDYLGFGFVDDHGVRVWRTHRGTDYDKIASLFWRLATKGEADGQGRIRVGSLRAYMLVQGACCVCNRPLTCPESIESGIGPVCAGREGR